MSGSTLPRDMLRLYRERSPVDLVDQAKAFRRMSEAERAELLFYMVSHVTMAIQQRDDAPARAFKDVERYIAGSDA